MSLRKTPSVNENWTKEETLLAIKKKALLKAKEHNHLDHLKEDSGLKKVFVPHPTIPRCLIEKWIPK